MTGFTTPFEWGALYSLAGIIGYAVSTNAGCLAAYENEAGVLGANSYQTGLITTDWSPSVIKNSKR